MHVDINKLQTVFIGFMVILAICYLWIALNSDVLQFRFFNRMNGLILAAFAAIYLFFT